MLESWNDRHRISLTGGKVLVLQGLIATHLIVVVLALRTDNSGIAKARPE
jgi:hypothetical protein